MKFLVYTVEPSNENATLKGFSTGIDPKIRRIENELEKMSLNRVKEHQTVSLLVNNIETDSQTDTLVADVFKVINRGRPLHQFKREDGNISIQTLLKENEEALEKGLMGVQKRGGSIYMIIEKNFGSYFSKSVVGLDIVPQYSAEAIKSIQQSDSIGRTTIVFADDYDLTASLVKPPKDGDVREEDGLGFTDPINKILSVMRVSKSHEISLDISRDEWLENVETFEEISKSGIVSTIKVDTPIDGIVKIGEGGDRAIRENVQTLSSGRSAVDEAFRNLSQ